MTIGSVAKIAARGSIIVFGLWCFFAVPGGQPFSDRILRFIGTEGLLVSYYFSIVDFALALALGILISHSIFWHCIVREKARWPQWGEPLLKALDYFWYAGAAVGLAFVAAQAQGELLAEFRSDNEDEIYDNRNWFISSLEKIPEQCGIIFIAPDEGASGDYETAYAVVNAVCSQLNEAGADRRELWVVDQAVISRCKDANIDYSPSGYGQIFSQDLSDNRPLLDAYSTIIGVCITDHNIREAREEIEFLEPFQGAVAFSARNPLFSGYISWFALLLAFRLSRTTAEVFEAVRSARKV